MNVIIHGFFQQELAGIVANFLNEFKPRYSAIFYYSEEVKKNLPKIGQQDWFCWEDVVRGKYPFASEKIAPLDEEIIGQMVECEVVTLKMMDRLEVRFQRQLLYTERKRLYLKHLRFWHHLISHQKIDLFLISNPPHEIHDYIIYDLCKVKKIPTVFFYPTKIPSLLFLVDDWQSPAPELKKIYHQLREKYRKVKTERIGLGRKFTAFYKAQILRNEEARPFYTRQSYVETHFNRREKSISVYLHKNINNFFNKPLVYILTVLHPHYWITKIRRLMDRKEIGTLVELYEKNAVPPDFSKKYIYFPLQRQPELSTSPLAGAYVEQILIAELLTSLLPQGVLLYVKEHPIQFQLKDGREREFYEELIKIRKVKLIARSADTFELIRNSLAVATSTGTAGWEALFQGKPVLLFGHYSYQYAPGVFPISSTVDCANALREILEHKPRPSKKELKLFLKAMEEVAIRGFIDMNYKLDSDLTNEENVANLSRSLSKKIRELNLK